MAMWKEMVRNFYGLEREVVKNPHFLGCLIILLREDWYVLNLSFALYHDVFLSLKKWKSNILL